MTTLNPIADAVEGAATAILGPVIGRLVDLIPDPAEKARQAAALQQQLITIDAQMAQQQGLIDAAEAASTSTFVAGWRPFIGWVCGAALVWQVIAYPFLVFGIHAFGYTTTIPVLDNSWITAIMLPMLGLGGMRTYEKVMGVAKGHG